jgi:hypothetical protein
MRAFSQLCFVPLHANRPTEQRASLQMGSDLMVGVVCHGPSFLQFHRLPRDRFLEPPLPLA